MGERFRLGNQRALKQVGVVLVLAFALAAFASWRHHARWISGGAADGLTGIDSFMQMLAAPGWLVGARLLGADVVRSMPAVIVIYATWFAGVGIAFVATRFAWRRASQRFQRVARPPVFDAARRAFVLRAPEAVLATGVGGVAYSTLTGPWSLRVARQGVSVNGLAPGYSGLRVLQISDIHHGPRIPGSFVRHVVRCGLSLNPDLVVLTGDYIHNFPEQADEVAELLQPLVASVPTVGVLGNHDWYGGGLPVRAALERVGVRMIDNDRCWLAESGELADSGGLCLAGVGDLYEDTVDFDAALSGVPDETPRLLLSHNPDVAELPALSSHRVDLMLSGHTHGGQIRLPVIGTPGVPSRYGQKYARGLVQGPNCRVHVSAGVGMSIAPVRFGVPPEINLLTLRSV